MASYNPDVLEKENKKVVLLGNEAIARGAVEAGLGFCACYPGTPSSEVSITLQTVAKEAGFYFEWSTNEKVAFEACAGAAWSGVRSLTAMKHFGLNVASDSVLPVVYTGVRAGMILMVADDPQGHSSAQSEQDTRYFARMGNMPVIEPSNTQECKDFTVKAFEISEKYEIPVFLRTTTMVSHSTGTVKLGKIVKPKTRGFFAKSHEKYCNIGPNLQKLHANLLKKLEDIENEYSSKLNFVEGGGKIGIITSGISYEYVKELGSLPSVRIAKLSLTYPFPKKFVAEFLKGLEKVIVVEELEPFVEDYVRGIAKDVNPNVEIHGKDIMPRVGEYNPDIVKNALAPFLKIKKDDFTEHEKNLEKIKLPVRKPVLCPGCPHRSTFYAVKKILGKDVIWAGDVGCYALGVFEPFEMQDFLISMGASLGISQGIGKVSNQKIVAFIGDSTFFHASMPPLVNLKYNDPKPIVIVLDNGVTAMTGHQPHPGSGITGMGEKCVPIKIEDIVKSFGIDVRVVNAYSQNELQSAVKEFSEKNELGVIVSRGLCRLVMKKMLKSQGGEFTKFYIDPKKCVKCLECVQKFACPAIMKEGNKIYIREDICLGCGVCSQICPKGAIKPIAAKPKPKKDKKVK
jgi:indolepyruvate ferredoxin oxidoreductase alpha subunit